MTMMRMIRDKGMVMIMVYVSVVCFLLDTINVSFGDVFITFDNPRQNIFQTICGVLAFATMTKII